MSILSQTTNLIRLFMHTRGEDEVPPQFYLWAFLTTIAACVRDKVHVKLLADAPIYPNLYTLLYGPSGCGKGTAIEACTRLVKPFTCVNLYEGTMNGPSLFKKLHEIKRHKDQYGDPIGSKMFLVMEELAMDAGAGKEASQFVKYLVGLWKPKPGTTEKTTIGHGTYTLEDRCINVLMGSTKQWVHEILTADDLKAGGGRRIAVIEGHIDPEKRIPHPILPPDRPQIINYIQQRLELLTQLEGEITKTPAAMAWEDYWYRSRPAYTSEAESTPWRQLPELMNQIAIALVLADGGELRMKQSHLQLGLKLGIEAQKGLTEIILHGQSMDSGLLGEVFSIVRDHPGCTWEQLVRMSGLLSSRLQGLVTTLIQSGRIFTFKGTDTKTRYSTNEVFSKKNKLPVYSSPDPAEGVEPPPEISDEPS